MKSLFLFYFINSLVFQDNIQPFAPLEGLDFYKSFSDEFDKSKLDEKDGGISTQLGMGENHHILQDQMLK